MAHTFTSILIHIIFSTKNRDPLLTPDRRQRLFPYMGGILRELQSTPLLLNGTDDHLHILTSLPATRALSDLLKELKAVSSGWARDTLTPDFGWQTGYAAFSVSQSAAETVRTYIANQERHHQRISFQDEYLQFLKRHNLPYDPRFVFDGEWVA
jgi:REP element-mobilizing transposase RayT